MFAIIIIDNITIHCYNYCLCCYLKFICYYLFIKCFGFHMPWQLPFPVPTFIELTINCTTRTFKSICTCIYLYHICHIHVFLKLRKQMQFKGISNQITIALIINFGNFKTLIIWWLFISG